MTWLSLVNDTEPLQPEQGCECDLDWAFLNVVPRKEASKQHRLHP